MYSITGDYKQNIRTSVVQGGIKYFFTLWPLDSGRHIGLYSAQHHHYTTNTTTTITTSASTNNIFFLNVYVLKPDRNSDTCQHLLQSSCHAHDVFSFTHITTLFTVFVTEWAHQKLHTLTVTGKLYSLKSTRQCVVTHLNCTVSLLLRSSNSDSIFTAHCLKLHWSN
jgi:hypothetical protein